MSDIDKLDAALFRFWIYGASHFPGAVAKAIVSCSTQDQYRIALYNLAREKRCNLPAELDAAAALKETGE